jgi:transcriptional regulator
VNEAVYTPKHFEESRTDVLHELIRAQPLATFIVARDGEIVVNHFPLVVSDDGSEFGVLKGHVPRANTIWESLRGDTSAVAVFQGPSAYITPSWYPSLHQHGKALPTWNYVVAHARGQPIAVEDRDWLIDHLNTLVDQQESTQAAPWKLADAPSEYVDAMLGRIVGIEMRIAVLQGKRKLSQNRSDADRLGVAAGLRNQGNDAALALAALVREYVDD